MFNFFSCNCSSFVDGLESENALVYVDNISLADVDEEKVVKMIVDLTVILEGCRLNKETDSLYLLDLSKSTNSTDFKINKLDSCFFIPILEQDDSSSEMFIKISLSAYPGLYKLYYLRSREKIRQRGDYLYGVFEILGSSSPMKIDCINQNQVKFQSPPQVQKLESRDQLRDITNLKIHEYGIRQPSQYSDYMNSIEDEKPNTQQSQHLTPQIKRK